MSEFELNVRVKLDGTIAINEKITAILLNETTKIINAINWLNNAEVFNLSLHSKWQ